MDDVFGQKPNRRNLIEFFKQEAIQALWWSAPEAEGNSNKAGFTQSDKLKQLVLESPLEERKKVQKLLGKVSPAGLAILP